MRDEHRVAREARGSRCTAAGADGAPRSCRSVRPVSAEIAGASGTCRVDERLELVDDLEAAHLDGADLADLRRAGPQPGRLEVDDDVRRVLEQEVGAERSGEPDRVAVPREPRVGLDHLGEERAGERDRRLAQREEPPRRLLGDDRPAPLLDELHEPVGGV